VPSTSKTTAASRLTFRTRSRGWSTCWAAPSGGVPRLSRCRSCSGTLVICSAFRRASRILDARQPPRVWCRCPRIRASTVLTVKP
jgi:hypothetical protein